MDLANVPTWAWALIAAVAAVAAARYFGLAGITPAAAPSREQLQAKLRKAADAFYDANKAHERGELFGDAVMRAREDMDAAPVMRAVIEANAAQAAVSAAPTAKKPPSPAAGGGA